MRIERWALAGVAFGVMLGAPGLGAQGTVVGTFRWQLQPFCNAVTVTVTQQGASPCARRSWDSPRRTRTDRSASGSTS
jgi:hypothetical protein